MYPCFHISVFFKISVIFTVTSGRQTGNRKLSARMVLDDPNKAMDPTMKIINLLYCFEVMSDQLPVSKQWRERNHVKYGCEFVSSCTGNSLNLEEKIFPAVLGRYQSSSGFRWLLIDDMIKWQIVLDKNLFWIYFKSGRLINGYLKYHNIFSPHIFWIQLYSRGRVGSLRGPDVAQSTFSSLHLKFIWEKLFFSVISRQRSRK